MGLIRMIKRYVFGKFDPNYEYWVRFDEIKLPKYLKYSRIGHEKYEHKLKYFRKTGKLESKIILDKNFYLVDGYSSYVIAKKADLGIVPVYFKM